MISIKKRRKNLKKLAISIVAATCLSVVCCNYANLQENTAICAEHEEPVAISAELASNQEVINNETAKKVIDDNNVVQQEPETVREDRREEIEVSRGISRELSVIVTAYDLSVASCEKPLGDPAYGLTSSGFNLSGHTLESARAIAVDPDVIPMGSYVRISFDNEEYQYLNGMYKAVDTGGAIIGHHIDLFFGDMQSNEESQEVMDFGVQKATIEILE